jgi:hypothetical protein
MMRERRKNNSDSMLWPMMLMPRHKIWLKQKRSQNQKQKQLRPPPNKQKRQINLSWS